MIFISLAKNLTFRTVIAAILCGVFMAHWFTLPTARFFNVPDDLTLGLAGLFGISGLLLVVKFINFVTTLDMNSLLGRLIRKRMGTDQEE